jgi:hypothetical protein
VSNPVDLKPPLKVTWWNSKEKNVWIFFLSSSTSPPCFRECSWYTEERKTKRAEREGAIVAVSSDEREEKDQNKIAAKNSAWVGPF